MLSNKLTIFVLFLGLILIGIGTVSAEEPLSAIRMISTNQIQAGSSCDVQIEITANEDVYGPAIIEKIPTGWILTPKDTSQFEFRKNLNTFLKMNQFKKDEKAVIKYDLMVPSNAPSGEYLIEGYVNAYKLSNQSIGGNSKINVISSNNGNNDYGSSSSISIENSTNNNNVKGTSGSNASSQNNNTNNTRSSPGFDVLSGLCIIGIIGLLYKKKLTN